MKLSKILQPELIEIGLIAEDKWKAIEKMAKILAKSKNICDVDELYKKFLEREKNMTTGLGHGVGIPHAMSETVNDLTVAAATLSEPLDFESFDFKPISVIFAIASPIDRDKRYMIILSQIARLFDEPGFSEKLAAANTSDEFIEIIEDAECKL